MVKARELKKQAITANRNLSMDGSAYQDGEAIGSIELPKGVDPRRVIEGLRSGKIILGDKNALASKNVTDTRATQPGKTQE